MRLYYIIIISFTCISLRGLGQPPPTPNVAVPTALKSYVIKGYNALNVTEGDLNLDGYPDAIMILYKKGEEKTSDVINHPEKRPLFIFAGQPDKTYKLVARNDNAVYCVDCGGQMGDPFMNVTIKYGYFSVEHYGGSGWRWTRIITFKYSPAEKNWYLYKDGEENFLATEPENVKTKVKTAKNFGKVPFKRFDIYK